MLKMQSMISPKSVHFQKGYLFSLLSTLIIFTVAFFSTTVSATTNISDDIPCSTLVVEKIAPYSGEASIVLNDNLPDFYLSQLKPEAFVVFSPLDSYGRTGIGFACLGRETIPTTQRGTIGNIQPSGWHTIRYDDLIEDRYLYNRSHIIGFLLSGDNATPENLFTGTRFLNAVSMVKYEISIAQYIEQTGNHVLYRITPCYHGTDLVAFGVQMEAYSIEDHGNGICFNVFLYNIQPGILIDYSTGNSQRAYSVSGTTFWENESDTPAKSSECSFFTDVPSQESTTSFKGNENTYVFNNNTKLFHLPTCSSVIEIKPKNRQEFYGSREDALVFGYKPCKLCNP